MKYYTMSALCFAVTLIPGAAISKDSTVVVREAPPNAKSMAGYMVMENHSDMKQIFLSASANAFAKVMFHHTELKDSMVYMTHQKQVIIAAQAKIKFAPGGYHLMLVDPKQSLRAGDRVTVKFIFANKSQLSVNFKVHKAMSMKCGAAMKH